MARNSRQINHLLIIRLSALGDIAMVPHAIRALRGSYPNLKITVLSKGGLESLFDGLDVNFVAIDLKERHKGFEGYRRLASEIKAAGVDGVADLHDTIRTKIFRKLMWFKGISVRHINKEHFSKWMRLGGGCGEATKPLTHTVIRYCTVLRKLGFVFDDPSPASKPQHDSPLPYSKGDERWIGVAPFSANEGKIYPLPLMKELIGMLSERYDRIFVHSGPGEELAFAEEMEREHSNVVTVFSRMRIRGEVELISLEDCIVSMDSFAMHIASLVATPCVSVWGATHPWLGYSGYGFGSDSFVQLNDLDCRPCSTYGKKECKYKDYRCLHGISPTLIAEHVDAVVTAQKSE